MLPAFRSKSSALSFSILLIVLLGLPVINFWIGHPLREQAYDAVSSEAAGPVGMNMREIFRDSSDADVLFLGSSLVRAGIDPGTVEQALSAHLGRPAKVQVLALNWQGLDLQYFLLRDYLAHHHAGLIVWNMPVPGSRNLEPHVEAFRWIRFGEYSDALAGLSWRYRMAIYADMVLGAPRETLSHLRPNLLGSKEVGARIVPEPLGYYGAKFVPEPVDTVPMPTVEQTYEDAPYRRVTAAGKPLDAYEQHFARLILELAKQAHTEVVLIHIPIDTERGMDTMPERGKWDEFLHTSAPMIGTTSADLFRGVSADEVPNYYRDQHLNANGMTLFTRGVTPAILKAYDTRDAHDHQ